MTDRWSPAGAIAQLGERLLCKQEVVGSIPSGSTSREGSSKQTNSRPQHYGLARAKGSQELLGRVISDIVKRRSFRVTIVVVPAHGFAHLEPAHEGRTSGRERYALPA